MEATKMNIKEKNRKGNSKVVKWEFIDTDFINSSHFGFKPLIVKVGEYKGSNDIRTFHLSGWVTFADLMDSHPATGEQLKESKWFIFAAR
jgi:hypothetical protein